jgi:hypothetical protein
VKYQRKMYHGHDEVIKMLRVSETIKCCGNDDRN